MVKSSPLFNFEIDSDDEFNLELFKLEPELDTEPVPELPPAVKAIAIPVFKNSAVQKHTAAIMKIEKYFFIIIFSNMYCLDV